MKKISIDPNNINYSLIKETARVLSSGGIVAMPTETVYGLGGRADIKEVVSKLYDLKQRPKDKPFSFALSNIDKIIDKRFDTLPAFGYRLIEKFWPGPLTIIYYAPDGQKVGIRVPSNIIAREILEELGQAIYLPSANISGQKEAVSAQEVEDIFNGKIDLIVDGGKCDNPKPSTLVDLTSRAFKVLREGAISEEDIIKTFVRKRIIFVCTGNSCRSPMAHLLFEKYLKQQSPYFEERFEVISRGIAAFPGSKVTKEVLDILSKQEGLDASDFRSERLDRHMILSSDLIFTMENIQTRRILNLEPKAEGRVFNLSKFLPPELEKDIPDPIGRSKKFYDNVYSLIREAILELVDWV